MGCGGCGGTELLDDPQSGDTVCTTCGLVVGRESSLHVSYDYCGEIVSTASSTIVKVVSALELEPASDWIDFVQRQGTVTTKRMTRRHVCEILLREDGRLYERMRALGVRISRPALHHPTAVRFDDYGHWIRLSGLCETRDEIRALNNACQQTVDRQPMLRFVLPPLFVVAMYANMVRADKKTLARIASETKTHTQSVNRIMKKIKT